MAGNIFGLSLFSAYDFEVAFVEDIASDMPDDDRFEKFADCIQSKLI